MADVRAKLLPTTNIQIKYILLTPSLVSCLLEPASECCLLVNSRTDNVRIKILKWLFYSCVNVPMSQFPYPYGTYSQKSSEFVVWSNVLGRRGSWSSKCYPRARTARQKQKLFSCGTKLKTHWNLLSVAINRVCWFYQSSTEKGSGPGSDKWGPLLLPPPELCAQGWFSTPVRSKGFFSRFSSVLVKQEPGTSWWQGVAEVLLQGKQARHGAWCDRELNPSVETYSVLWLRVGHLALHPSDLQQIPTCSNQRDIFSLGRIFFLVKTISSDLVTVNTELWGSCFCSNISNRQSQHLRGAVQTDMRLLY